MSEPTVAASIEQGVKAYIRACNDGDADRIAECFCSDAVHYFPTGPKWSGASTIGANFSQRVRELGHLWTVDKLLVDADRRAAALEWTQFAKNGRVLRGIDWFVFEAGSFQIQEIRAYGAAPIQPDLERQELRDFRTRLPDDRRDLTESPGQQRIRLSENYSAKFSLRKQECLLAFSKSPKSGHAFRDPGERARETGGEIFYSIGRNPFKRPDSEK